MRHLATGLALALPLVTGVAHADTVDFQDGVLNVLTQGGASPFEYVISFEEQVSGVTFTFMAENNLVGADRFLGGLTMPGGIHVGGGGGSVLEFSMTVDQNVTLTGYATGNGGFELGSPTFDLKDGGSTLLAGAAINPGGSRTLASAIALTAGTTYIFDINNTGAGVQGFIRSLTFTPDSTAVPLPASGLLLLGAAGGMLLTSRVRRG